MTIRRSSSNVSASSRSTSCHLDTHNPAQDDSSRLTFNSLSPNKRDYLLYDENDPAEIIDSNAPPGNTFSSSGNFASQKDSSDGRALEGCALAKYIKSYLGEESDKYDLAQFTDLSNEFHDFI